MNEVVARDLSELIEDLERENPNFRGLLEDAEELDSLRDELVTARERLGLTQAEVAGVMGTKQSAVSAIERGAVNPRIDTLMRLARAVHLRLRLEVVPERGWAAPIQGSFQVAYLDAHDGAVSAGLALAS